MHLLTRTVLFKIYILELKLNNEKKPGFATSWRKVTVKVPSTDRS